MKRILVAGIGNIFFGDDAFGCEVIRELAKHGLPDDVEAIDFGIRGYDLAYAIAGIFDAVILVDATPRGGAPGTVYLLELDMLQLRRMESATIDAHSLDPVGVLRMADSFGARPGRLFLVGCEPAALESENGQMGLSDAVQAAVPKAVEMIDSLMGDLSGEETKTIAGLLPA